MVTADARSAQPTAAYLR